MKPKFIVNISICKVSIQEYPWDQNESEINNLWTAN